MGKRVFALALAIVLCMSLCACGGGSTSDSGQNKGVTNHKQAVKLVQDGDGWTSASWEISQDLGFKQHYAPSWGTCTAGKNEDGSWNVTLKGSMFGYLDDYNQELENLSFEYTVTIDPEGEVQWSAGKTTKK